MKKHKQERLELTQMHGLTEIEREMLSIYRALSEKNKKLAFSALFAAAIRDETIKPKTAE